MHEHKLKEGEKYTVGHAMANIIELTLTIIDGPIYPKKQAEQAEKGYKLFMKKLPSRKTVYGEQCKFNRYKRTRPLSGNQILNELVAWYTLFENADFSLLEDHEKADLSYFLHSIQNKGELLQDWIEDLIAAEYMSDQDRNLILLIKQEKEEEGEEVSMKFLNLGDEVLRMVDPANIKWE